MPNITVCQRDDLLIEVANQLIEKQIDALPIVKEVENGIEVIGRITKTNVTRALVDLAKDEII
ncbi:CBS domain-containing protein, partial [Pantoea sp. SIMBA_133]